jgi:hypothetical protein
LNGPAVLRRRAEIRQPKLFLVGCPVPPQQL